VREPRLLVVANPYESAMIRRAAEYAGVVVREADAEDVEAVMREVDDDVVVVAAALAHGEGVSVIGRVRATRGSSPRPRIIAIGGEGTPVRSLEDARRLGADDFMPRPVDLEGLVARIMRAGGRRMTGPMAVVDLRSMVAARVEADLTGALDEALGAVGEPAAAPRATLRMPAVPPAPPGASVRTTLQMPAPEPAAAPHVRTTSTMPTAPQARDTIQMPTALPPAAFPEPPFPEPPARDTVAMPVVEPRDTVAMPVVEPRDTVPMPVVEPPAASDPMVEPPAASEPAVVPPAAAPPPRVLTAAEGTALRARVEGLLPLVREGDYFAVLGLPRDATAADVERAWREARRDLEPAVAEPALGDGLRESLAAVRRVLDEAHRVLCDDATRGEYRAHI
jgi:ActR/RegA family two-component response regulator